MIPDIGFPDQMQTASLNDFSPLSSVRQILRVWSSLEPSPSPARITEPAAYNGSVPS